MKMLPSGSQVTSVGWRNRPSCAGTRRIGVLQGMRVFVGCFGLAAEHHHDAALGIELDDHVRAFIDGPEIVLAVDTHGVREGPGVQVVADFAHELAILVEEQDLRGGGSVRGTGGVAAREDVNLALGIHRDAGGFAEVQIVGQLEEIGIGIEGDFGHGLLRETCGRQQAEQGEGGSFHEANCSAL